MQLADMTVEVRDKALKKIGQIRPEDLNFSASVLFNNVGSWTLALPTDHHLVGALRTPGSGIIVTGPNGTLFSGPTVMPSRKASKDDPYGTYTIEGVTDEVVLADMIAYPDPTNANPTTQTKSHDTRTGSTESLMHQFVNANCGPGAVPARRKAGLIMGANGNRGPVITKNARFPVLGSLIGDIAVAGQQGFRIVQRGSNLVFETYLTRNMSSTIRLDIWNNTLLSEKVTITPPGATQVIVAGQGDLTQRQFYAATNAAATAAEVEWGRRIERFVDQRQTDDPNEHIAKANEVLASDGFTGISMALEPMSDSTMRFGIDWDMGDRIAVVSGGIEYVALTTGLIILADPDGFRIGAQLGDRATFDPAVAATAKLDANARRIDALERAK